MKKHYLRPGLLAATAALTVLPASCQLEERGAAVTGEVDFRIEAGIPAGLTTYAQPDLQSHLGGANNLDKEDYDLRYILEVWTDETRPKLAYRAVEINKEFGGVTFEARLLAKKYNFVFWADFVADVAEGADPADFVYKTNDLTNITYAGTDRYAGRDEADAYTAVVPVDLTLAGQSLTNVTLKRPFGKIRLVATDELSGNLQTERPNQSKVVYGNYKVPTTYNALSQAVSGEMEAGEYVFAAKAERDYMLNQDVQTGKTAYILGYDYIFASDEKPSYAFDVTVYSDPAQTAQIGYRSLSGIPVQRNKLTTVIGNFYSNAGSLQVVVEDAFNEPGNIEDVVENVVTVASSSSSINAILAELTANAPETISISVPEKLDADAVINVPAINTMIELILEKGAQNITISGESFTGNFILDNNSTENSGNLVIYLPNGDAEIKGGSYSGFDVTTK